METDTAAFSGCGKSQMAKKTVLNLGKTETNKARERPRQMSS